MFDEKFLDSLSGSLTESILQIYNQVLLFREKDDQGTISAFLIEKGSSGFTQKKVKDKCSLRASDTGELVLEGVRVPLTHVLPKAKGLKTTLCCLDQARYGIAWGAIGAAMACYDVALNYAK